MFSKSGLKISLCAVFISLMAAGAYGQAVREAPSASVRLAASEVESMGLHEARLADLDVGSVQSGRPFSMTVPLDGEEHVLDLRPHSLRGTDFRVEVKEGRGLVREVTPPPPMTYQGTVRGQPGSAAAVSFVDGRLHAMILVRPADSELWFVQPLERDGVKQEGYVVYNNYDVIADSRWTDIDLPNPNRPQDLDEREPAAGDSPMVFAPPPGWHYETEIACDTDYEFFTKNGASVNNTIADIEMIMNGVDVIYKRDLDIAYEIVHIVVRTTSGSPYPSTMTNPDTLLTTFRNEWRNNYTGIDRDVAHLFTGKNLDGSVIGVGWVKVVCEGPFAGYGYALSQSRFTTNVKDRTTLTAHEIGHNYGCNGHCDAYADCFIMCSGLGGCDGVGLPNFGPWSIGKIATYAGNQTCLDLVAATSTLDVDASIGQGAIQVEVSPPDMNGNGNGTVPFYREYSDGTMVTLTAQKDYLFIYLLYRFKEWKLDGVSQPELQRTITLPADFVQARCEYALAREFTAGSSPASVTLSVTPPDLDGVASGSAPLDLVYFHNQSITLEAPQKVGALKFVRWELNGNPQPLGVRTLDITVSYTGPLDPQAKYAYVPLPLGLVNTPASGMLKAKP